MQRWKASGLSAPRFAAQEGIARPQSLWWWSNKLSRPRESSGTKLKLVQVTPVDSSAMRRKDSTARSIEIRVGAFSIAVSNGFDVETFRQVVAALDSTQ